VLVAVLMAVLAACGDDGEEGATATTVAEGAPQKFACLDFEARVVNGPNAGRAWTGDLVLGVDKTGLFTGFLVPSQYVDRDKLEVRDTTKALCRAIGQRNGAQISWFLYCQQGERIFGTGQITSQAGEEELRGIISGPRDEDTGVYHGRNYPPYIRTISGDAS
jgi:hypothetical protein